MTGIPNTPNTDRNNGGGVSRDAKVGIGIGCYVAGIIGAVGFFIFYRKTKSNPVPEEPPNLRNARPMEMELEGSSPAQKIFEVDGKQSQRGGISNPLFGQNDALFTLVSILQAWNEV